MKIGRLFRRKRRGNRDDSTKDASNRGSVDDGHEPPPNHGSSEMANRGSSEFPSHVLNTTTPLPSISRRSNNRTETGSNGHRSQIPPAPPSPSMNDDTHASESEDVVSEMITTVGGKRRINKGVPDSFKGLTVSHRFNVPQVAEDPQAVRELSEAYDSIPEIEQIRLPRGGISIDTKAVGRIQFGIPPETIKDSMRLGIPVPQIYIVPAERFCREMGPALGVNLAEFEFPGYFNFFICRQKCTMVVDSQDAQEKICSVLSETLLGPGEFLGENPRDYNEEDFAPDFPRDAIPNFQKELEYFRKMPDGSELAVDHIYDFCHFKMPEHGSTHTRLGVPAKIGKSSGDEEKKESEGRWFGDVATVWPNDATEEQKKERNIPRVEIFKMASGLEYIIHDVDENNHIIGRARFNGHIKVSEMMSVEGFSGSTAHDFKKKESTEEDDSVSSSEGFGSPMSSLGPPSFHPPSFGVTTLGNSHGFDKSGSTSGYVLWVNGRGIMIDPPPYSSATLEREGIRPRTIVGIILTHCHADHDAGAFQKVLTGSPVVVITTPTIYKSFIRKYAALASVSPALLRHCHRYKPAIVGEALRFQGANFRFQYSLHAIPCVGFRVDWRGRSMVFSGDHLNKPVQLDQMQKDGVLSKARGDDLRNLPLQETDLLLHEAGVPPLHTPLEELMKLPQRVRKRLYVVHTATIPEEYDLRVAPTGTAGTLRLDKVPNISGGHQPIGGARRPRAARSSHMADDDLMAWGGTINEYEVDRDPGNEEMSAQSMQYAMTTSFTGTNKKQIRHSITDMGHPTVPLVGMRPASSTDAWFILNLLSAVPFMSSLSYASTMEVLETARVEVFAAQERIIEAERRRSILCVVWEGTCVEKNAGEMSLTGIPEGDSDVENDVENEGKETATVWHAGDWTGPIVLQPDKRLSGESERCMTHDIVALSSQGVKVITIDFSGLHQILKSGSGLYRKYLDRQAQQNRRRSVETTVLNSNGKSDRQLTEALRNLNIIDLLDQNFALRKLSAVQKRHMESLAAGPISFEAGARLWRDGAPVDRAFMMVSGTASFVPKRRNAGSATAGRDNQVPDFDGDDEFARSMSNSSASSMGEKMTQDALKVAEGFDSDNEGEEKNDRQYVQLETLFSTSQNGIVKSMTEANDFADLSKNLQRRADAVHSGEFTTDDVKSYEWEQPTQSAEEDSKDPKDLRSALQRKESVRARFENKVLGRIHSREAYTGGLVFSRGHFLGDISRMFYGHVNTELNSSQSKMGAANFDLSLDSMHDKVIQDDESDEHREGHTSTLIAGKEGCVVLVFDKASLIPFLDEYPGLLLSLLGTQVVV